MSSLTVSVPWLGSNELSLVVSKKLVCFFIFVLLIFSKSGMQRVKAEELLEKYRTGARIKYELYKRVDEDFLSMLDFEVNRAFEIKEKIEMNPENGSFMEMLCTPQGWILGLLLLII